MARGLNVADFRTEADLCAAFIKWVPPEWVCYPETGNFDILLSRKSDGVQIGIEAKLTLNSKVIEQIVPRDHWYRGETGPDFRAILVPWGRTSGLKVVCDLIAITVIEQISKELYQAQSSTWYGRNPRPKFRPDLPGKKDYWYWREDWHDWCPENRIKLPDYVPDVSAGSSAPVQLSEWKISAIKLCIVLERRGYVTTADFGHLKLSASRWIYGGWLERGETKGRYVRGRYTPNFRPQHPVNYGQIEADYEKWSKPDEPRIIA